MKAVVVYESLTGNTRKAAIRIAAELQAAGVEAAVCPITRIDYEALSVADMVIVGSWVDGFVFVGQRPGRAGRFRGFPAINGKRCAVFCTYAVDPGQTLNKLADLMRGHGADVVGGMAISRLHIDEGARELVDRLLAAVPA